MNYNGYPLYIYKEFYYVMSLPLGKIRLAERSLALPRCMNVIYEIGNERASSLLFQGIISIM
jgi:hypothetical protein